MRESWTDAGAGGSKVGGACREQTPVAAGASKAGEVHHAPARAPSPSAESLRRRAALTVSLSTEEVRRA